MYMEMSMCMVTKSSRFFAKCATEVSPRSFSISWMLHFFNILVNCRSFTIRIIRTSFAPMLAIRPLRAVCRFR